jgi:small subunit ribosomal protein S20
MAITSSAKKAIRNSDKKRVFNLRRKDAMKDTTKSLTKALAAKDVKTAEGLLSKAYATIDKAKKGGVIKANTASRKKSRLAGLLAKAKA